MFIPTHLKFDRSIWSTKSKIKLIATPSVGTDHLDVDFFKEKGIKIISLSGETELTKRIYSPAELAFCHLLNISRKFNLAVDSVRNVTWSSKGLINYELHGKTVGIIGFGSVGNLMSKYCQAFGMKIITYDPYKVVSDPDVKQINAINELLIKSDIISIHEKKNNLNHHFIDENSFNLMKRNCIFINISRGGLIEEKAMLDALKVSKIYAAVIDVLEGELSEVNKSLIDINNLEELSQNYKNLFITPHLGGSTYEGRSKRSEYTSISTCRKYQQ